MNFDNEKFSSNLYKIEPSKLLLLDFGKFDKKEYSYVCQDFDDGFLSGIELSGKSNWANMKDSSFCFPAKASIPAAVQVFYKVLP